MAKTLAQKFFIKPGERILVLDPPEGFIDALGPLPEKAELHAKPGGQFDLVQCFAKTESELQDLLPRFKPHLEEGGRLWLAYPKGSSKKYHSEINRDSIWRYAQTIGMTAVSLLAVDDDWSTMRIKFAG